MSERFDELGPDQALPAPVEGGPWPSSANCRRSDTSSQAASTAAAERQAIVSPVFWRDSVRRRQRALRGCRWPNAGWIGLLTPSASYSMSQRLRPSARERKRKQGHSAFTGQQKPPRPPLSRRPPQTDKGTGVAAFHRVTTRGSGPSEFDPAAVALKCHVSPARLVLRGRTPAGLVFTSASSDWSASRTVWPLSRTVILGPAHLNLDRVPLGSRPRRVGGRVVYR